MPDTPLTLTERAIQNDQERKHKCWVCTHRRVNYAGLRCAKLLNPATAWAIGHCKRFDLDLRA